MQLWSTPDNQASSQPWRWLGWYWTPDDLDSVWVGPVPGGMPSASDLVRGRSVWWLTREQLTAAERRASDFTTNHMPVVKADVASDAQALAWAELMVMGSNIPVHWHGRVRPDYSVQPDWAYAVIQQLLDLQVFLEAETSHVGLDTGQTVVLMA